MFAATFAANNSDNCQIKLTAADNVKKPFKSKYDSFSSIPTNHFEKQQWRLFQLDSINHKMIVPLNKLMRFVNICCILTRNRMSKLLFG